MMGLYLITGGSASGKSEYGEAVAAGLRNHHEQSGLFYVAAMYPYDEESRDRIRRHQKMRDGKGFDTIECHIGIQNLESRIPHGSTVLIECMSNLLANELYLEKGSLNAYVSEGGLTKDNEEELKSMIDACIVSPLLKLSEKTEELVIITNDVFSDGESYAPETEEYIRLLGYVNQCLAYHAERVVRVVSSIPVIIKQDGAAFGKQRVYE